MNEGIAPLVESISLECSLSGSVCFLGDDFSSLVFHELILGLTSGLDLLSSSPPHLSSCASLGDSLGPSLASDNTFLLRDSSLSRNTSLGGAFLSGNSSGGSSLSGDTSSGCHGWNVRKS